MPLRSPRPELLSDRVIATLAAKVQHPELGVCEQEVCYLLLLTAETTTTSVK